MRSLLFAIWIKSGKDVSAAIALVEGLVIAEYETLSRGGARIVSANVAGKQFTYELPSGWSTSDFIDALRLIYRLLTTGGASGGQMTDEEANRAALDLDNQSTSVTKVRFSHGAGGRI